VKKSGSIRNWLLPPGPILSLTLIGLLLLSAVLYYRAVKVQRFLEPALAISEPRIKFTQNINALLVKELSPAEIRGIKFKSGSIFVEQSFLYMSAFHMKESEPSLMKSLGMVFLKALEDPDTRGHISLVLVGVRYPPGNDPEQNKNLRSQVQENARFILDSLYAALPELEKKYGSYFTYAPVPLPPGADIREANWIEFRIVPTERLHIEFLKRLGKYTH
jgi:hypothetical protein